MTIKIGEDILAADIIATAGTVWLSLGLNQDEALTTSDTDQDWVDDKMNTWKITEVVALCGTASSSGSVTIDIKKNGVSILTTQITISAGQLTSKTAPVQPVIDVTKQTVATGDRISATVSGAGVGVLWAKAKVKFLLVPV